MEFRVVLVVIVVIIVLIVMIVMLGAPTTQIGGTRNVLVGSENYSQDFRFSASILGSAGLRSPAHGLGSLGLRERNVWPSHFAFRCGRMTWEGDRLSST